MERHPISEPPTHQFLGHKLRSRILGVNEEIQGVIEEEQGVWDWGDAEEQIDPFKPRRGSE